MIELRQSTAGQEIPIGQALDSTDGDSPEPGLTIANTDIKIWKWGATTLASKNSGGATYISNGVYYTVLDATDSNTLGALVIFVHVSGALAMKVECAVLTANQWDSKYSTDKLEVDLIQMGGVAQSLIDLKDFADAGYDPATNKVEGVKLVDTTTTNTDMVGTDSAALASVCTETRLAELDAGNLPTDIAAIPTTMRGTDSAALASELVTHDNNLAVVNGNVNDIETKVDLIPTTAMRGTDNAATETKQDIIDTNIDQIETAVITNAAGVDIAADIIAVKVDTAATLLDTGTDGVLVATASKTGYSLSAAGIDSVLDEQIGDGTITMREALRVFIASLAGKASGGGTTTITFRDDADSKNVIVATVDVDGNRTATTLNP